MEQLQTGCRTKLKKVTMIDLPEGWKYGWPKAIPTEYLKSDLILRMWIISNGYPDEYVDTAMRYYRCWEVEEKE